MDSSLIIYFLFAACTPFVAIAVLYCLTRLLKFKHPSLKKTFFTILLSTACWIVMSLFIAIGYYCFYGSVIESGGVTSLVLMVSTLSAETIAIKKLFAESWVKAIFASILSSFGVFLFLILAPIVHLLFFSNYY